MYFNKPNSAEMDDDVDLVLSENMLKDMQKNVIDAKDLWEQWKASADFVNKKWIYRYTDEKQKAALQKHWDKLTGEKTSYSIYKRSYQAVCKFMGLDPEKTILEWIRFDIDKVDKEQWKISVRYSKGRVKVKIPKGIRLIHVSPVQGLTELTPTFRSRSFGKYMWYTKRVFFSIGKEMSSFKANTQGVKRYKYTTKEDIEYAYIDPTYSSFSDRAVYIETDKPIPVELCESRMNRMMNVFKVQGGVRK